MYVALNCMHVPGKGDLVGCDIPEECNGTVTKSSCAVKAITYCDLKCINLAGLVEVLRLYPEFHKDFAHDILHDLTYNLREGYEAEPDVRHRVLAIF